MNNNRWKGTNAMSAWAGAAKPYTPPDQAIEQKARLDIAMEALTERERLVLKLRFHKGTTQTGVSVIMGLSKSTVRLAEKSALKKMRENAGLKELRMLREEA